VGILDFVFDEDKNDREVFHHDVKLIDTATNKIFYDKLTYIYLEMPKFNKTENELKTRFDKWLYVLKSLPKFQAKPKILKEHVFNKLFHIAELANFSPADCISYEASLKAYRDNFAVMKTAIEEAKSEGLAEGEAKGKAEGEKSIVLKMWSKLQSVEEIHAFTDIPVATIIKILKQNGINP
jgi:predicted transposase/invertase (TIGR01784 family)